MQILKEDCNWTNYHLWVRSMLSRSSPCILWELLKKKSMTQMIHKCKKCGDYLGVIKQLCNCSTKYSLQVWIVTYHLASSLSQEKGMQKHNWGRCGHRKASIVVEPLNCCQIFPTTYVVIIQIQYRVWDYSSLKGSSL